MKNLTTKLFELTAVSVLIIAPLVLGCSSASTATGTGGTTGTGMGSGGATATGTGGSSGSVGGMTGTNPDANCTNSLAKTGALCTQDCLGVPSGLNSVGTRNCPCLNGAYSSCTVSMPANWGGAATAPCCPAGSTAAVKKNTPCDTLWAECITSDAMSGTTYQGCACLADAAGVLNWECGSTNKWFALNVASNGGVATCM